MPLSVELSSVPAIYSLASILLKKFLATFSAFPAMTMTNLIVQRQEFNLLGFRGGQPYTARVKDTVTDLKVQTPSGSSVKISPEAQALYEKARAAEVTPQRTAIAPTTAEPDSISVQAELSFDQFVERFMSMSRDYWGNEPGEPIVISKFAEKAKDELQDASARVRSKLANAGITLTPPVELAPDRAGTGVKVGPHPLREKIEALINEDPGLANDYREAMLKHAHATELQRTEKAHLAYAAAYDSGRVDEALRIIKTLASAAPVQVTQRFADSGIETLSRSI